MKPHFGHLHVKDASSDPNSYLSVSEWYQRPHLGHTRNLVNGKYMETKLFP